MGVHISTNFGDLLDARIHKIFDDRFKALPSMLKELYSFPSYSEASQKQDFRVSEVGALSDVPEFTGAITYDQAYQQYDRTITYREYGDGIQVERKLYDDDLRSVIDNKPKQMASAWHRTREKFGASVFNNASSIDSTWMSNSEGVPLVSDTHLTASPDVSTAIGFDNLITSALSSVSLIAARIQMVNFRDDRGNRISVNPDMILFPADLYGAAYEIVESSRMPDTALNNANVNQGRYKLKEWLYLDDANDWFLIDSSMMKDSLYFIDRVPYELAMVEDFDTLVAKWRLYARLGLGWSDWRWILGAVVA